jgi:hypothetical protein
MLNFLKSETASVYDRDYTGDYAKIANAAAEAKAIADQKVIDDKAKAEWEYNAEQKALAEKAAVVPSVSAGTNFTGITNNLGPQAMNSNAGGVASLVSPQVTVQPQPAVPQQPAVNYTSAPSSQQQLEDQAVNAGYQGDYSDTAAMQGYLNSNAGGVASLVGPQVTVQPQPAVTQQPTSNIVAGVGTNPALRAKVLAAQAANMKK